MSADEGSAPARALRVQHAEAYRLHIIESVYPAHITGMTMALLITVVSKVRHPGAMRLVDDWSWSDFRGPSRSSRSFCSARSTRPGRTWSTSSPPAAS